MKEANGRFTPAFALLAVVLLFGLLLLSRPIAGNHVNPVYVGYAADCADLAPAGAVWHELRVAPVNDGVYGNQWVTVNLDVHWGDDDDDDDGDGDDARGPNIHDGDDDERTTLDWSADRGVDGVFVKGGPGGYFYEYTTPAHNDWRLSAPPRDDDDDDDYGGDGDDDDDDGYYNPEYVLFCVAGAQATPTPPQSSTLTATPPATESPTPGTSTPEATTTPGPVSRRLYLPSVCSNCSTMAGEPNNSCETAYMIQVNAPYNFFPDDVHDWYRLELTSPGELEVRIENFQPLHGQVSAYAGPNCQTAAFLRSNGQSSTQKILSLGRQPVGVYHIYVSNDGVPNGRDSYHFIVEWR